MERGRQLYEGKAKVIFATERSGTVLVEFKDDATAFNAQKRGTIRGKGHYNRDISAIMFRYLEEKGVPTQYVESTGETGMVVHHLRMIPVEVVVRNVAAGSLSKRLGIPEGTAMRLPVVEFYFKDDDLGDPIMNEYHIYAMDLATPDQVAEMVRLALKVNEEMIPLLERAGLRLVDFKLEFGVDGRGRVVLGDEISPDTCRFWDADSGEKMDKDRFRRDLGKVEEAYREVLRRLEDLMAAH